MSKPLNAVQLTAEVIDEMVVFQTRAVVIDGTNVLRSMQELVTSADDLANGRRNNIEFAPCDESRGAVLVLDEEGLYHAPIVPNIPAMALWRMIGDLGCMADGSRLFGNVLVVGSADRHGDTRSAPAWVFEHFDLDVPTGPAGGLLEERA